MLVLHLGLGSVPRAGLEVSSSDITVPEEDKKGSSANDERDKAF